MAWVNYNKSLEPITGKRMRFVGWYFATKQVNRSIESTVVKFGSVTILFDDVKHIRKEFSEYTIDQSSELIRLHTIPGYSTYTLPLELVEVWDESIVEELNGVNYADSFSAWQRYNDSMLLDYGDSIRIITRTEFHDEYKCSSHVSLDVTNLTNAIRSGSKRVCTNLAFNHHKKMRSGQIVFNRVADGYVQFDGVDDAIFYVPVEYTEVQFGLATLADRQQKHKSKQTKQTTKSESVPTETKKEKSKMELQFNAKDIMEQNKDAFLVAAKIEVGEIAVQQVTKIVKKQLPPFVRGYADLPIFEIVLANMVVMAIRQFCPENDKALIIADAMLLSSMQKQIKEFNIPKMVEEFTSGIDISSITKLDKPAKSTKASEK